MLSQFLSKYLFFPCTLATATISPLTSILFLASFISLNLRRFFFQISTNHLLYDFYIIGFNNTFNAFKQSQNLYINWACHMSLRYCSMTSCLFPYSALPVSFSIFHYSLKYFCYFILLQFWTKSHCWDSKLFIKLFSYLFPLLKILSFPFILLLQGMAVLQELYFL